MNKLLKVILGIFVLVVAIILSYIGYVYFSYSRIKDNVELTVNQRANVKQLSVGEKYQVTTFNLGYGSYTPDYTFFMDGGKQSKAVDKETVEKNISGAIKAIQQEKPDFALFQEVDEEATRSRHVNEVTRIEDSFPEYSSSFAVNYNSAYLMYPILDPIGKSKSGLLTLSNTMIENSIRHSLPIETNFNKFFDLDRSFTVTKIPVENGKFFMLYNVHLSAYIKDKEIQKAQMLKLFDHMEKEYDYGNYIVCGGDFNHDLLDSSSEIFENESQTDYSWLQAFPEKELPKGFNVVPLDGNQEPVPSVRNLDKPYKKGESFVAVIDGFITSDNVKPINNNVVNLGFQNSDHNPVKLGFKLEK